MKSVNKYIIIDFDHTIGYFKQIIFVLNVIEKHFKKELTKSLIFKILDNFPYIFRPKIYRILDYININRNNFKFFILYTFNNNKSFVNTIIEYMREKLNLTKELFDYEIFQGSTKDGKSIEYIESNISLENDIVKLYCYIDDKKYHLMKRDNVQYIHCEKYIYNYKYKDIIHYFPFDIININHQILKKYMKKYEERGYCPHLPRNTFVLSSLNLIALIDDFIHDIN